MNRVTQAIAAIKAEGYDAGAAAAKENLIVPIAEALRTFEIELVGIGFRADHGEFMPHWDRLGPAEREPYLLRAREIVEGAPA